MTPIDVMRNYPIRWAIALAVLVFLAASTVVVVPESRQAVIERGGKPVRVANRYRPNDEIGRSGAGLLVRVPFAEQIVWVDKRMLDLSIEKVAVQPAGGSRLVVAAAAHFRITDPARMLQVAGGQNRLAAAMAAAAARALRQEAAARPAAALLLPDGDGVVAIVRTQLDRAARRAGAQVTDFRIVSTELPAGPAQDAALARMREAQVQAAAAIRLAGAEGVRRVRMEGNTAAARVLADSFGRDPEFYAFYRSMQSYKRTFGPGKGSTSYILSPSNAYLRDFQGRR